MKKLFCLIPALCALALVACKNDNAPYWDHGHEVVSGMVYSEDSLPLRGIQITKFADEQLQYYGSVSYSDAEGHYCIDELSRSHNGDPTEFYLVVKDTTGVYQSQTIQAQMNYTYFPIQDQSVGSAEINIMMRK